jgi:Holliday junction resolvase-like predicted endonuclease
LRSWVLQFGTEKALAELKSSADNTHLRCQQRGLKSEGAVIRYLESRGGVLLAQRLKTSISEIDLVFLVKGQILLIEVKTLSSPWRSFDAIQRKQLRRLIQNKLMLKNAFRTHDPEKGIQFSSALAWVSKAVKAPQKDQVDLVVVD